MCEEHSTAPLIQIIRERFVTIYVAEFSEESTLNIREGILQAETTGQTILPVLIDSYGGDVLALLPILDLLEATPLKIATVVMGKAMSAGAILLAAGEPGMRFAAPSATVMIHEASTGAEGRATDLLSDAAETSRINNLIFAKLDAATDNDPGHWQARLRQGGNADLYMTANDARKAGIVDHVRIPRFEPELLIDTRII